MGKKASLKVDLSFDRDDNDDDDEDDDNFPDFYDRDEDHAQENTGHSASAFTTASAARTTTNSEEMMADKNNTVALPLFRHGHDGSSSKKKKSTEASSTEKRHGGEESTEDENGVGNARGHLNECEMMSFAKSKNDTAAARSNHRDENKNKDDANHIYETSTPSSKSPTNQRTQTKTRTKSRTRTRTTQTNTKPKSANSANAAKSSKHAGATPAAVEIDLSHHSSRHPVFSTHMNDGILLLIASYLEFRDVMSLARVNKYNFHEGLGVDCLFCRDPRHGDDDNDNDDDDGKFHAFDCQRFHSKDGGNDDNSRAHDDGYDDAGVLDRTKEEETLLLPCLYPYKEKLLPVILPSSSPSSSLSQEGETMMASMPSRPSGLARTFARETVIFSKACVEFASAGSGGSIPGPGSDGHLAIGNRNNNDNNNSYNDATTSSAPPTSSFTTTSSSSSTMAPKKIINLTTTERILLTSFKHVTWTHAYSLKSGIRLSYVTNDNHNSALVTVWSKTSNENEARSSSIPSSPLSTSCSSSHHSKERYVPPNVHSILEAAFHSESGLCAILATSLGGGGHDKYSALVSSSSSFVPSTPKRSSSLHPSSYPSTTASTNSSGYILSLIELPRQPFSRNNAGSATVHPPSHSSSSNHFNPSFSSTAAKFSSPQTPHSSTRPHQHTLKWQKYLSNHQWKLFSSSSTRAIVSFSPQGTHVLFGSTETWGLVDVETGSRVWTLFRSHPSISRWNGGDGGADTMGTMPGSSTGHAADIPSPRSYPTAASFPSPSYPERASSTSSRLASPIDAHLIHRGFLFVLQDNGKVLRIYDELDLSCPGEPLAEGDLPWSPSNSNYDSNNHHRYHRGRGNNNNNNTDRDQADFQLEFCSGRIWITGTHKKDLLCSTPPRLLRRLRSRNNDTPLHLKFLRVMNDLSVSTPHTMLSWNDTHLYILDSNKIYRWNAYRSNVNSRRKGIITVYSGGNKRVQNFHVDGTKLLICTVNPYWDTSKRIWEGNERMWVVPIDSFGSIVGDGGWTEHLAKLRKDGDVPFVQRMRDQCQLLEQPVESFDQTEVFLKKVLPSCQSSFPSSSSFAGANDTITDLFLRNVNGVGGVSNYHVLNMECDGRFVTLHCERSGGDDVDATVKLAVLDLYKT